MSALKNLFKRLDEPFPFFFNNDLENTALITGTSIFSILFLVLFEPFGHGDKLSLAYTTRLGIIVFIGLGFNILLLPRLIPGLFDNWNVQKYILFNFWNIILVGVLCGVHNQRFCPPELQSTMGEHILEEIYHTFIIGIVPLFMMTFMIKNRILRENLANAQLANSSISSFRQQYSATQQSLDKVAEHIATSEVGFHRAEQQLKVGNGNSFKLATAMERTIIETKESKLHVATKRTSEPSRLVIQSDTNESLELQPETFLYAEAQDNYVKLNWLENGELQSHLLRLSMKKLEFALASEKIIRCHRSYLVNLAKVDAVKGNANGYRLHMLDTTIPVSRSKGKFVLESIERMSLSRA